MTAVQSPLLTKQEACEYLRVSMTTLDRYMAEGRITVTKVGNCRFTRQALDDFLAASTKPAVPPKVVKFNRPSVKSRKAAAGIT